MRIPDPSMSIEIFRMHLQDLGIYEFFHHHFVDIAEEFDKDLYGEEPYQIDNETRGLWELEHVEEQKKAIIKKLCGL